MSSRVRQLPAIALASAVCGLFAFAGAPADAHEVTHSFTGNRTGEAHAVGIGEPEFSFGHFTIKCKKTRPVKTHEKGTFPSHTLYLIVSFVKCTTAPVIIAGHRLPAGKALFKQPLEIEYRANGWVEVGASSSSSSELKDPTAIEIEPGAGSGCLVTWAPQTVPDAAQKGPNLEYEAALYETLKEKTEDHKHFPDGVQEKLMIKNAFTQMSFTVSEGLCAGMGSKPSSGAYQGSLLAEVSHADLGWE